MTTAGHSIALAIPVEHPALAGHFPGAPVAPGVLVLDLVLSAAESWLARPLALRHITQVKFYAPLPPGAQATAHLSVDDTRLRFQVEHAGSLIADGSLALAAGIDA
jgi:3-hydroxyacyl-[acyl-carrier-protein] dehydratase